MNLHDLIDKYIAEVGGMKPIGASQMSGFRRWQAALGSKDARKLQAADVIAYCRKRKADGVKPSTVALDVSYLRGPLSYAAEGFGIEGVSTLPVEAAMPILTKYRLIARSRPRTTRPSADQLAMLIAHFRASRHEIPMDEIVEFQVASARRISETCRLLCADVDRNNRTCIVRDMKDPRHKQGNDHEFPLLGRAWEIVDARLRDWDGHPEARIFPDSSASVSQLFRQGCAKLGIKGLRLHDLRREGASRLLEAGYSVPQVQVVTGHKDPSMLLRVYTKLSAKDIHSGPAGMNAPARRSTATGILPSSGDVAGAPH